MIRTVKTLSRPVTNRAALAIPARPARWLLRVLLVTAALIALANQFAEPLVRALLPAMRAEVEAVDGNIAVSALEIAEHGASRVVHMRANLAYPIVAGGTVVYPFGFRPGTEGWYQIYLTVRGVLQSSVILWIVVLSWPATGTREGLLRALIAVPLTALLITVDAPLELIGNFHNAILHQIDPAHVPGIFVWDKFLEGGGNSVLALAAGAVAIAAAIRLESLISSK